MPKRIIHLQTVTAQPETFRLVPGTQGDVPDNPTIAVCAGDGLGTDGVWLNGEPSIETSVVIDGVVEYLSPVESAKGFFDLLARSGRPRRMLTLEDSTPRSRIYPVSTPRRVSTS